MTARGIYEALLVELNKVDAPSLLLEDYNYFINKAINLYINKRYAIYDTTQQTTDDLRVLKSTAILNVPDTTEAGTYGDNNDLPLGSASMFGATFSVELPPDYLHMLNCICNYELSSNFKCYNKGDNIQFAAKRLSSDDWSQIINNAYMCPMYKRPYFYIHHVNQLNTLPTNEYNSSSEKEEKGYYGTDQIVPSLVLKAYYLNNKTNTIVTIEWKNERYKVIGDDNSESYNPDLYILNLESGKLTDPSNLYQNRNEVPNIFYHNDKSRHYYILKDPENENSTTYTLINVEYQLEFPKSISIKDINASLIPSEKPSYIRHGNPSRVRCEIRYGKDHSVFKLTKVFVDYIKIPLHVRLTLEQVDRTKDTSLIMEFPDYVCQEIINELVMLVLENAGDLRFATQKAVSTSIVDPTQQLAQTTAPNRAS